MKELDRLKIGDEIKFTEAYLDFWYNEAFSLCSTTEGIKTDEDAKSYLIRKILSLGYPYKAVIISDRRDGVGQDAQGNSIPGYKIRLILKHGLVDDTWISIDNMSLYRRKKKS